MGKKVVSILIFGASGGLLRYLIQGLFIFKDTQFPYSLIIINLTGSFVLGLMTSGLLILWDTPDYINVGVTNGLLGGFTTYSSFELKSFNLIDNSQLLIGAMFIIASIIGAFIFALIGQLLGEKILKNGQKGWK